MEEEEEEQDTSLKGRLMSLVYMIKGRPQKTEEKPTEQEQAAPSKACQKYILQSFVFLSFIMPFVQLYLVTKTVSWGPEQSKLIYANISKEKVLLGSLSSKTYIILTCT